MFAQLVKCFTPNPVDVQASTLYAAIVKQARMPIFYTDYSVPDSIDGRFDMIVLHLFLIIQRLKREQEVHYHTLAQALVDVMMQDMDRSLREMGVADTGVGKRIKRMADAQHGRMTHYEKTLDDRDALKGTLIRNLYGTIASPESDQLQSVLDYIENSVTTLKTQKAENIARAELHFATI